MSAREPDRTDEARLEAALASALERAAARSEPVAVVVALVPREPGATEAARQAALRELVPGGLAFPLADGRVALVLPGVDADEARARAARIASACPGVATGAAVTGRAPTGPRTLLAEAEAEALLGAIRRRVLVVEDDPHVGEVLAAYLTARGYEAVVARSGAEALASVRERAPDAAVVDLELPDLDGAALVARLRQSVRDLPAIACSGKRPETAAGAGFTEFHRKPLDLQNLARAVDGLLRRRGPS